MRKAMRHRMTIYHAQSIHTGEVHERLPLPRPADRQAWSDTATGYVILNITLKFKCLTAEASACFSFTQAVLWFAMNSSSRISPTVGRG